MLLFQIVAARVRLWLARLLLRSSIKLANLATRLWPEDL
jgi:hypothetical protein